MMYEKELSVLFTACRPALDRETFQNGCGALAN